MSTITITITVRCPTRPEVDAWLVKRGFEPGTPGLGVGSETFYQDQDGRGLFLAAPESRLRWDRAVMQFIEDAAEALEVPEETVAFEMGLIDSVRGSPS